MNDSSQFDYDAQPAIKRLEGAIFALSRELTASEPQQYVIRRPSNEVHFLNRKWQYCKDIMRVLDELKLTFELIKNTPPNEYLGKCHTTLEDFLIHQQGQFVSLTHQLKDKIWQLVRLMTLENLPKRFDVDDDVNIKNLLEHPHVKAMGIAPCLGVWLDIPQNRTGIGTTLRHRTKYQHYVSPFNLHPNLLNVRFAKTMLTPESKQFLTDYGLEKLRSIREDAEKKLQEDILAKTQSTYDEIVENVSQISEALIAYYDLPKDLTSIQKCLSSFNEMLSRLHLTNQTDMANIDKKLLPIVASTLKKLKAKYEDIVAVYLIGSLPRGDFKPNYSDINFVVILSGDHPSESFMLGSVICLNLCTQKDFLEQNLSAKRLRFFCYIDGLLVYGTDILPKETYPQPGIELAWLLNHDILSYVLSLEGELSKNDLGEDTIMKKSRELAKRLIDFIYGIVVITNTAFFTFNREERMQSLVSGPDKKIMKILWSIIDSDGCPAKNDLLNLIDLLKPQITKINDQLIKTIEEIGEK